MKVSEIAQICGYEFYGNDAEVNLIRFHDWANCDDIAIAKNLTEIENTKANCVLTIPCIVNTKKTLIYTCDSIELAAVKIARAIKTKKQELLDKTDYTYYHNYYVGKNVSIGEKTVISPNVYIDDEVQIGNNCFIAPNVHIARGTIIKNNVMIGNGSSIGSRSFYHYYEDGLKEFEGIGRVVIEEDVAIGNSTTIQRGTFSDTVIKKGCKIGNLVDIGHDVTIGENTKIVSQTGVASGAVIGNMVTIYGQVGIANNIRIGNKSVVYAKSLVTKNLGESQYVSGIYARDHGEELRLQVKMRKL